MGTGSATASVITALLLAACGSDASPELVVRDAAIGGGTPTVLGADADGVYWSVSAGSAPKVVAGAALAMLPAESQELGTASGPIAQVGDHVVFATDGTVVRVGVATPLAKVATVVTAETLAESAGAIPILAWTEGAVVSWGNNDLMRSATLNRIVRCDHVRITASSIYVAAEGTPERRLFRIDRGTDAVVPLTASSTHAALFPGGGVIGASYRGRLVGADAIGALWLVEETVASSTAPSRGILVSVPEQGEPSVVLEHVNGASGFFTTPDAFYWQERDALLTAPRTGGSAAIVAKLPGAAGAVDSGFVYFVDGNAIRRLAVD